jgi:catabolite repression HPr-like protein
MVSKDITISIPTGAENHSAASLVQVACQFDSNVYLEVENKKVNAKSIMGMMSLSIYEGCQVKIITKGTDETEAMEKLEEYLTVSH